LFHRVWIRAFVAGCLAAGAIASVAQTSGIPQQQGARAETAFPPAQYASPPAFRHRDLARSPRAQSIQLGSVSAAKLAAENVPWHPGIPHKIGFSRAIPDLATAAATASNFNWQPTPQGGLIGAISVTSTGALGVRLGVLVQQLPATATLRFYAQGSTVSVEVPAQTILNNLSRNQNAGDSSDEGRTYWAPTIDGPEATLEIELPAGTPASAVAIAIPRLAHLTQSRASALQTMAPLLGSPGVSASCEVDVSCYPAWSKESNATALMQFVSAGSAFMCSGTLLNTVPATFTPYFLSANHCISTQTAASTLETVWFFHSTSCNSGVVNPSFQSLSGGATLLYAAVGTDTSFLWLDAVPPGGAAFAGWDASLPNLGVGVTDVHHPMGDLQKIAFGATSAFENCEPQTGSENFNCTAATQTTSNHLHVNVTLGMIEPGSSGSGLYITDNSTGSHYLIGQLHGGSASCTNTTNTSDYGRFDVAYSAALAQWLSPTNVVTVAASSNGSGTGTISSSPGGINCGTTCNASFPAGTSVTLMATPNLGSSFAGWSGACAGSNVSCTVPANASTSVAATFNSQSITPQAGYWWNPAQAGSGFVIEVQDSSMFMAGFLYSSSGEATWISSFGPMTTPTQYTGQIVTFSGGQTLTGAYRTATQNPTTLGTIAISFSSASAGTLTWPGGSIPIQRLDFGPGGSQATQPAANPQTGWWLNPAEGGRGFAIEVQGGAMYFAGYMYDASGNPVWYLSNGNLTSPTLYQGVWQQFAGGQTLTGTYRAPTLVIADVGSVTLQTTSPTTATLTLPDGRQIPLIRYVFGNATAASIAGNWSGTWQWSGPTSSGCPVNDGGSFSMTIQQSGNYFTGSNINATGINTVNTDCSLAGAIVAAGGTASGTISGNNLNISFTLPTAGSALTFTGTAVLSSNSPTLGNSTLTGSIVRSTGGTGSFSITLH
jgi:lysyl endopeptidase